MKILLKRDLASVKKLLRRIVECYIMPLAWLSYLLTYSFQGNLNDLNKMGVSNGIKLLVFYLMWLSLINHIYLRAIQQKKYKSKKVNYFLKMEKYQQILSNQW